MARAALIGMDPLRIMRMSDPVEQEIVMQVIGRAEEIAAQYREDLARSIINSLGEALKPRGRRAKGR